jgi:hypothetical protein
MAHFMGRRRHVTVRTSNAGVFFRELAGGLAGLDVS